MLTTFLLHMDPTGEIASKPRSVLLSRKTGAIGRLVEALSQV